MTAPVADQVRGETILEVDDLVKHFPITQGVAVQEDRSAQVKAVDGVELRACTRARRSASSASPAAASPPWPGC